MNNEKPAHLSDVFLAEELLKICRRILDNDQLTIDDDLFESRRNWFLAAKLLFEIEKLTGKKLSASIIFETGTVRELLKRANLPDEQFPPPGYEPREIIHLFYGDFNFGGAHIRYFLDMLGEDHRINPVQPHIPQEGESLVSMEDMARERLQSIIETQPDGPYTLVGYCAGALVGFEVARLLVAMGKDVKAMVMIDPIIISLRKSSQAIFKMKDFSMRMRGVPQNKRHARLVMTWKMIHDWNIKTKDVWRLTHLISVWKKMTLTPCRIFDIPHPVRYIFHRSWRDRIKLLSESGKAEKQRPAEKMLNPEFSYERFKYYWAVHLDYQPLSLNVPVLYISLEYSGRVWRRISPNTTFLNICRGVHSFWKGDFMPSMFDKIKKFIDR